MVSRECERRTPLSRCMLRSQTAQNPGFAEIRLAACSSMIGTCLRRRCGRRRRKCWKLQDLSTFIWSKRMADNPETKAPQEQGRTAMQEGDADE